MKVDRDVLQEYIAKRLINMQPHPTADLFIYNYTPVCQYSRAWDDITLMCRGLILDGNGNVVARPFKKFFNYEENPEVLPANESFKVYEKFDGSLGISYKVDGHWYIATRGSFESDQAKAGTEMLREYIDKYGDAWIEPGYTHLFEIIYPGNRIVVDYGEEKRLVLIAKIDTETGQDADIKDVSYWDTAKEWYNAVTLDQLRDTQRENAEGYVILFESGLRVKMKYAEYVRLHRLLTQVSSKSIWDLLRKNESIDPILDNIPDEFYDWVTNTVEDLKSKFARIKDEALANFKSVPKGISRKEQAAYIHSKKLSYPALVFLLLDGKSPDDMIWKLVKPAYEQAFRVDEDT